MGPARERFDADQPPIGERDLRLVVRNELAVLQPPGDELWCVLGFRRDVARDGGPRRPQELEQLLGRGWLGQDPPDVEAERLPHAPRRLENAPINTAGDDDRAAERDLTEMPEERDAVERRHLQVDDEGIEARWRLFDHLQSIGRRYAGGHLIEPEPVQMPLNQLQEDLVVIHHENLPGRRDRLRFGDE